MDFFTHSLGEAAERTVWGALEELHAAGQLRSLGVCNYSVAALERLWKELLALCLMCPALGQLYFDLANGTASIPWAMSGS